MGCADCGHDRHKHAGGGVCCTITVDGPATPKAYLGADPLLHMGRTLHYCKCSKHVDGEPESQ